VDERVARAGRLYEHAVFTGGTEALDEADRELDGAEADLVLARGRIVHTRFLERRDNEPESAVEDPAELPLFERAAELYRARGDMRGEAEALFCVGCFYQVVRRDNERAMPAFEASLELAGRVGEKRTIAEVLRHLGIGAHAAGRLEEARERLEESSRLRRELGLRAGVAANLVGLGYIAMAQGRRADAAAILDEAAALAREANAQRILRYVSDARQAQALAG